MELPKYTGSAKRMLSPRIILAVSPQYVVLHRGKMIELGSVALAGPIPKQVFLKLDPS